MMAIVGNTGFISWIITVLYGCKLDLPTVGRSGVYYQRSSFVEYQWVEAVLKLKKNLVSVFLLSFTVGSVAMSLGEMRGAAWVGQALDLRVPIELDESTGADALCLEAEVIYGELPQAPGRIRVSVASSSQASSATVRIQSLNLVNEPVVTVFLKAGCLAKTARRYVLLADVPAGTTSDVNGGVESIALMPVGAVEPKGEIAGAVARTPSQILKKRVEVRNISQADHQRPVPTARRAAKSQAGKPRLSLDPLEPLELRFERTSQEPSMSSIPIQMTVLPGDVPAEGLEMVPKESRLKKLEADLLSMQAQLVERDQGLSQLRDRLKQAESERHDNPLVYGLFALLTGALLSLAYVLRRQAKAQALMSQAWFEAVQVGNGKPEKAIEKKPLSSAESPKTMAVAEEVLSADSIANAHKLKDVDLDNLLLDSAHNEGKPVQALSMQMANSTPFSGGQVRGESEALNADQSRSQFNKAGVKTDPRQHAEFYVSLGQSDQAIKILSTAIQNDEKTAPMVYLDLLKIYHAMGMRGEYMLLSEKFTRLFKALVPSYAKFRSEGQDLVAYEELVAQISLHWSSPQAVDVINAFIYADPLAESEEKVDLQAFRDLLLLRAVAQSKLEAPIPEVRSGRAINNIAWQG